MAERDFYNINDYITYPLIYGDDLSFVSSGSLPRQGLVDAGFMMGIESGFLADQHNVTLHSVEVMSLQVRFDFRSDAPGLSGYRWLFVFPVGFRQGCVDYVDATTILGGIPDRNRGYAFLNIGNISDIVALGVGLYLLNNPPRVEQALIQSLIGSFVSDINLADDFRLCPVQCCHSSSSSSSSSGISDAFLDAAGIVGAVQFKEGFNAQISVNTVTNAIVIGAGVGAGAGQPCHDINIDEHGISLDACGTCRGFIRSINGITSVTGSISLAGGSGVTVSISGNTLIIRMDVTQLCLLSSSSSS